MADPNIANVIVSSLTGVWSGALTVLGNILVVLIVLVAGLIVAWFCRMIVEKVVDGVKLDKLLKKTNLDEFLDRAGMKLDSGKFLGKLIYWFIVVVVLMSVSEIVHFYTLSNFLREVALYIPNVIVAVLIMLAGVVVANATRHLIRGGVKSAKLHSANFLGQLAWWAIIVFGFLASLSQLGIAVEIINAIVTGFVAMLALAGGIAFGIGGKDYAAHLLNKMRERVE